MMDHRDPRLIPRLTLESLLRYAFEGVPTGDFLRSFLAGDLFGAARHADPDNARAFVAIAAVIDNYLPSACVGSHEFVAEWLEWKAREHRTELARIRREVEAQLRGRGVDLPPGGSR